MPAFFSYFYYDLSSLIGKMHEHLFFNRPFDTRNKTGTRTEGFDMFHISTASTTSSSNPQTKNLDARLLDDLNCSHLTLSVNDIIK